MEEVEEEVAVEAEVGVSEEEEAAGEVGVLVGEEVEDEEVSVVIQLSTSL